MNGPDPDFDRLMVQVRSDDPAVIDAVQQQALRRFGSGARWQRLAAMAFDRARALAGREQKFGTQFVLRDGGLVLWPVDAATTDSERAKWGIGPLAGLGNLAEHGLVIGKAPLRRLARSRRDAIAATLAQANNTQWLAHALPQLAARASLPGAIVAAYWPLPGEADPRPLARELHTCGATLALPVVHGATMHFRAWQAAHDADATLQPAGFGTFAPGPDAALVTPTLVLAPLVAFDARGTRLGQGKGYYDRYLASVIDVANGTRPFVVGVAFACQQLPAVPSECHDLRLDAVVTEQGWFALGG